MEAVLYDMCNTVLCVLRTRWYGKLGGMAPLATVNVVQWDLFPQEDSEKRQGLKNQS